MDDCDCAISANKSKDRGFVTALPATALKVHSKKMSVRVRVMVIIAA